MKVKHVDLEWYVLRWDHNNNKVIEYNILKWLKEDIANRVRTKKIYDKSTLKNYLEKTFMHDYWSKSECEFYISDLGGNTYEKIDIWRQIKPNLINIAEYVNSKMELNFLK